jgi:hypothetical protein
MSDDERRLQLARDAWRSMRPSDAEVTWAARRIATRFSPRKALTLGRRVRMVSGALATIAGIAYAGTGDWLEFDLGRLHNALSTVRSSDEMAPAPESRRGDGHEAMPRPAPRVVAVESLPVPVIAEAPATIKKNKARPSSARLRAASPAGAGALANSSAFANGAPGMTEKEKIDATWSGVNAALGSLDYKRAEALLSQLSEGNHDADTRAKAHLGLAQLAAARNDCERARVLALGVAAAPGVEMKTVRRALELAVSCAK